MSSWGTFSRRGARAYAFRVVAHPGLAMPPPVRGSIETAWTAETTIRGFRSVCLRSARVLPGGLQARTILISPSRNHIHRRDSRGPLGSGGFGPVCRACPLPEWPCRVLDQASVKRRECEARLRRSLDRRRPRLALRTLPRSATRWSLFRCLAVGVCTRVCRRSLGLPSLLLRGERRGLFRGGR